MMSPCGPKAMHGTALRAGASERSVPKRPRFGFLDHLIASYLVAVDEDVLALDVPVDHRRLQRVQVLQALQRLPVPAKPPGPRRPWDQHPTIKEWRRTTGGPPFGLRPERRWSPEWRRATS